MDTQHFQQLVSEASAQGFSGWDFSFIDSRFRQAEIPWSYPERVRELSRTARSLLDLGTGGGEFLTSLAPLPKQTCATEGYPPNVPIARERLAALNVQVAGVATDESLPYLDQRFELVINRHTAFLPSEVFRVLTPGGRFVTQQVGSQNYADLSDCFRRNSEVTGSPWSLAIATQALEKAGFEILNGLESFPEATFDDVGAVVYYLRAIPWQVPEFDVVTHERELRQIHQRIENEGNLTVKGHRFYLEARRPVT